jgi:hypothetical protein
MVLVYNNKNIYQDQFDSDKKAFIEILNNKPNSQVNLFYIKSVIDSEYHLNKSYKTFKNDILNFIHDISIKFSPYSANIFINNFMLMSRSNRKKLLTFLKEHKFNMNISYIYFYTDDISTSFL